MVRYDPRKKGIKVPKYKLQNFMEFIYDRHLIWHKRFVLKEPAPWSDDPLFRLYKFCNVYRELDFCTKHLILHVLENKHLTLEDKIFNILLYRRFNTANFFKSYGVQKINDFNWKSLMLKMDTLKSSGKRLFNDAYIICQRMVTSHYRPRDKHVQQLLLIEGLGEDFWYQCSTIIKETKSIKKLHKFFMDEVPMTGGFLAYQYCMDISYLPEVRGTFTDENSFVSVGPGALPGIHLICPKILSGKSAENYLIDKFDVQRHLWQDLKEETGKDWKKIAYQNSYYKAPYLSVGNLQNCFCEFRKYIMLQLNPNKKKRYFKPRT